VTVIERCKCFLCYLEDLDLHAELCERRAIKSWIVAIVINDDSELRVASDRAALVAVMLKSRECGRTKHSVICCDGSREILMISHKGNYVRITTLDARPCIASTWCSIFVSIVDETNAQPLEASRNHQGWTDAGLE